jgi:AraC-like DNA-binding protein
MLQYFHSGGMPLENGAEDEKLAHGGFLFQDLSQVARTMAADADNVVMILPRHLLESRLTFPEDHNMRFLSPRDPMVRILASMMLSFKANAYSFTAAQASILENSFVEVLAACLNAAHSGTSETALQQPHRETIALVRQYFRKNFTLPDLTPERAARELGISRSKLYQLMEDHGGVNRYVRDLRLRHAMNLLGAPAERGRSLYDIALECGFTSDTSFIRAFREKYGTTPGDFRRNSQAGCR